MTFKFYRYKKVKSTNDIAIQKVKKNFKKGIIVSDNQIKGRGQYGKNWISFKGNLFVSIFFSINKSISLKKINHFNCKIIKKALSKIINCKIVIKKPNDLLINKKKFAGVLQETIIQNNKKYLIIGIGINMIKSPSIRNYPSTNIFRETRLKIHKEELIQIILKEFKKNLKKFELNV